MDVSAALQTQLSRICKQTKHTLDDFKAIVAKTGLTKHGEIRAYFVASFGLGHADSNTLTHFVLGSHGAALAEGKTEDEILAEIYSGPKAALRPFHDALMVAVREMGDFEVAPKKGYVSLRRKKQFAMLGPATNTRFELGLNVKGIEGTDKLLEQPPGSMCRFKVKLTNVAEVDAEVIAWLKLAFDAAG